MKLFVPAILKMAHQLRLKQLQINSELSHVENNENALDNVVDPLTEFHVSAILLGDVR